jgi:hypothetical protein
LFRTLAQNSRNVDESEALLPASTVLIPVESFETLMLSYPLFPLLLEEITAQSCRMDRWRRGIKGGPQQSNTVRCALDSSQSCDLRFVSFICGPLPNYT